MEKYIKGTCQSMCPVEEAKLRHKERLLHCFEIKQGTDNKRHPGFDPGKVVKCFSRSAAGTEVNNPSNIRPFPVLIKTIKYLYEEIFPHHVEKPIVVYNFMFDRFRAVRQDAVIQNLPLIEMIQILEPIVKFFIYFGYILVEKNISEYDPYFNNKHLQECLKRLLVCYDECEFLENSRWELESAYLLFNLGNVKALTRGVKISNMCKDPTFNHCLKLSCYWYVKNFVRVLEMIKALPPLLLCIANNALPEIRKYSFQAMSYCYSSANSVYPLPHLKYLMLYEEESQVIEDCQCFNIKVKNLEVNFLKKDFDCNGKCMQGKRLSWIDDALLKSDLQGILCFGNTSC